MVTDLYSEIDRDSSRKRLLKYTRKAFNLLPRIDKPRILDVGCGSGVQTIELAKLSNGEVLGVDVNQFLLEKLNRKIGREGLSEKVETSKCSVFELEFPDESFEIIWAEGTRRAIGFEKALKELRRLLKPNGYFVVHDEIKPIANELEKLPSIGYKLVDHFSLPEDSHWVDYYGPLENRIKGLFEKYKNNSEACKMLEKVQNEIDIVKKNLKEYRSAFYIIQKN